MLSSSSRILTLDASKRRAVVSTITSSGDDGLGGGILNQRDLLVG
jgi:hypothetical protein